MHKICVYYMHVPCMYRSCHDKLCTQVSEEALAMAGVFSSNYDTHRPVGKGAFGFVRLAQRKSDKQMVGIILLVVTSCKSNERCTVSIGVTQKAWGDREMNTGRLGIRGNTRKKIHNIGTHYRIYSSAYFTCII